MSGQKHRRDSAPPTRQAAFRGAISCTVVKSNPTSPSLLRPNRRRNLANERASLPELPYRLSSIFMRSKRFGSLGGSAPSWKSWYIGISRARANLSRVSMLGTECLFSTREMSQRSNPVFFSISPCESFFSLPNSHGRSPLITEVGSNILVLWERRRVLREAASHRPMSWLAGKQFLNGIHAIKETIGLRRKRHEI